MYPFTFIFGGAMYPLTLHLGVQRKLTAFSQYVLRCLYIADDNRFIFLTEIKNVGKPETDIDV
jgi:hypothetical protein